MTESGPECETKLEKPTNINDEPTRVDIEEGIVEAGGCGRYQIFLQLVLTYLVLCIGSTAFLPFIIMDDPAWLCNRDNHTITDNTTREFCQNSTSQVSADSVDFNQRCGMDRSEWRYSTGKTYSIVTEYDLVCKKAPYGAMANSMFFVGAIVSAFVAGKCSDTFGRKVVMITLMSFIAVCGVSITFVNAIWQLVLVRGLYGLGLPLFNIGVIYLMEFVPSDKRALCGLMYMPPYSLSVLILDGIGYLERHWRWVQRYTVLPIFLVYIPIVFLPESPRWLLVSGKTKKAERVLHKMAKVNGTSFTSTLRATTDDTPTSDGGSNYTYLDLFRCKQVAIVTLAQMCLWLTAAMNYYAIGLESSKLGGNMYQVFAFSVLCELPGSLASLYFCNKLGRKKCIIGALSLTAILTCAIACVPREYAEQHPTLNIIFALCAKLYVNIAYCALLVWSFELNPTVIRCQGLLLFDVCENVGGIIAPFLVSVLQSLSYILPFIVMSAVTAATCVFALILPETNNKPTRENYEDFFKKNEFGPTKEVKGVEYKLVEMDEMNC